MRNITRHLKALHNERLFLEVSLILVVVGLTCLMFNIHGHKLVILNLFYLPVVLSGFFLGRYHTGVLALLAVIAASVVASQQIDELTPASEPLTIVLAMSVWAAVLGLTALLVGSLSEEKQKKQLELHEAYVGVVDVLSKYLQSANPRLKARSARVAELSQQVAVDLHLSSQQVDDIRVASLMQDLSKIEVTTRILTKAVDSLESDGSLTPEVSFQGIDLVHSLGSVLKGAIPLLSHQEDSVWGSADSGFLTNDTMPLGARIIRVIRTYDDLTESGLHGHWATSAEAFQELKRLCPTHHDTPVLEALARVTERSATVRVAALA